MKLHIVIFFASLLANVTSLTAGEADSLEKPVDANKPEPESQVYARHAMMIGKWLGEAPTKEGGVRRWLVERFENGTYKIHFQTMSRNTIVKDTIEVGFWGISGPVYFGIYRGNVQNGELVLSDPSDPYNYDAYEILELDENRFRYRHYETGNEFELRKVPQDYVLSEAGGA